MWRQVLRRAVHVQLVVATCVWCKHRISKIQLAGSCERWRIPLLDPVYPNIYYRKDSCPSFCHPHHWDFLFQTSRSKGSKNEKNTSSNKQILASLVFFVCFSHLFSKRDGAKATHPGDAHWFGWLWKNAILLGIVEIITSRCLHLLCTLVFLWVLKGPGVFYRGGGCSWGSLEDSGRGNIREE